MTDWLSLRVRAVRQLTIGCMLLAACSALAGCGARDAENQGSTLPTDEGTSASASETTAAPSQTALQTGEFHPNLEETFFLTNSEGWRAEYEAAGTVRQNMRLSSTGDGGQTWRVIADSTRPDSSLPGGVKAGLWFTDPEHGWSTANDARQGKVGLNRTSDGGVTWQAQEMNVPVEYTKDTIHADQPVFFTPENGMVVSTAGTSNDLLLYVTQDGGRKWQLFVNSLNGKAIGLEWSFDKNGAMLYEGNAAFGNHSWTLSQSRWTRDFQPGVFVDTAMYKKGSKEKLLADLVVDHLEAVADGDEAAYAGALESPALAEVFRFFFDAGKRYRFERIERIYALGDDPKRMNVVIRAERRNENGSFQEQTLEYTLRPNKDKQWRIAAID